MILKKITLIISLMAGFLMTGCGNDEAFTIAGVVNGVGTQNLRIGYVANGKVINDVTVAVDGKFRYEGSASQPTVVEIFTSSRNLIGCVYAKNGDAIEGEWSIDNPYDAEVSGNSPSKEWAKFLRENQDVLAAKNPMAANDAIARYVMSHRDNVVSTLLMITNYDAAADEAMADSLYNMIEPKARPDALVASYRQMTGGLDAEMMSRRVLPLRLYAGEDSTVTFFPSRQSYGLLCFMARDGRDTIVPKLRRLTEDYSQKRLHIVDIAFASDSSAWHGMRSRGSVSWDECWAVGDVVNKSIEYLSVPRTPYFIVVDSTGMQLYRGSAFGGAENVIKSKLGK